MKPFSSRSIRPSISSFSWMTRPVAGPSTKAVNRLCQPSDRGEGATLFTICLSGRRRILNSPRATSCWTPGFLDQGFSPLFPQVAFWTNPTQLKFTRRASCCARPTMLQTSETPTWGTAPCRSFLGAMHRVEHPPSTSLVEPTPGGLDRRAAGGRNVSAGANTFLQMAGATCLALGAHLGWAFFMFAGRKLEKPGRSFGRWGALITSSSLGTECPSVSSGLAACAH